MMMTLLFLREDAGHFSKGSEGERAVRGRAPERGGRRNERGWRVKGKVELQKKKRRRRR